MQETARKIFEAQSLVPVEEKVAPLKEVFRLQNAAELLEAEKIYLSVGRKREQPLARAAYGFAGHSELATLESRIN